MANTGSHNQPSHEAQVKGGQHSHSGSTNKENEGNKMGQNKGNEQSSSGGNR